jgi:hypothetical protein
MTIIVEVGDQRGSIHRLKIKRLEYRPAVSGGSIFPEPMKPV